MSGDSSTLRAGTRLKRWVLLTGSRLVVTGLLVGGLYVVLVTLTTAGLLSFQETAALSRMAGGMIAGTFSLITIVLTINQLILSQELGHAGKMEAQLESTLELRERVEAEAMAPTSPNDPIDFLFLVVRTVQEHAHELRDRLTDEEDSSELAAETVEYADSMVEETQLLEHLLTAVDMQSLNRITDILEHEEAFEFNRGRELLTRSEGQLSEDVRESLSSLVRTQRLFLVAQSYSRTMYLQQELARLSRRMLYVGLPATTAAFILGLISADAVGATIDPRYLPVVVSVILALVFAPLALLAAYMIRIATITQRTTGGGTFIP